MSSDVETIYDENGNKKWYIDGKLSSLDEYENGELIRSTGYIDGKPSELTEYENGEEIRSTMYKNSKPLNITEYENFEQIRSTTYDDGKLFMIDDYENGEEIRSTMYKNGKPSMITEYENDEQIRSILYEDGKPYVINEYENGEEIRSILYEDGKLSSLHEYKNDEETLMVAYKDNQIFRCRQSENDEVINEYEFENGKLLNITEYDDGTYKTIIFENDRIKEIEEYEDDELIDTIKYENIIDANELENKYISDLNNLVKIYNPNKILEDIQTIDKKGINPGYIYVLVNSSIKDMVKIGKTTKMPEVRAKEISSTTGVPTPFVVAYESHFKDCSKAEKYIHNLLEEKNHRTSKQREFFNISSSQAIKVIMEAKEELEIKNKSY